MSFIVWIILGSIALFVATKMVKRRADIPVPGRRRQPRLPRLSQEG